jgi:hypothetical protein
MFLCHETGKRPREDLRPLIAEDFLFWCGGEKRGVALNDRRARRREIALSAKKAVRFAGGIGQRKFLARAG